MPTFLNAVGQFPFLRYALAAGILAAAVCGPVGTFVVSRRIASVVGSIAHFVLGGIGLARYLSVHCGLAFLTPFAGACAFSVVGALLIGWVHLKAREREDTVIAAIWALGMAVGVLSLAATPGYGEDLVSYLFGNILFVGPRDLLFLGVLAAVVILFCVCFWRQLIAVCFDEEFAHLRGVPVEVLYSLVLCLTALTVVALISMVGVVLVIALVTLPSAAAGRVVTRWSHMMVLAGGITACVNCAGLWISFERDLPAGATIVILASVVYLGCVVLTKGRRRWV